MRQTPLDTLIAGITAAAEAHGTSVRCPECGAGAGKFCRVDMRNTPLAKDSRVIKHEARVALARQS